MFYNLRAVKRLMKAAYKGNGLIVGLSKEGWFYTSGKWWTICQDLKYTPKEFKAAVIELCGDLPAEGEAYEARKGEQNQMVMDMERYFVIPRKYKDISDYGIEYKITPIMLEISDKTIRLIDAKTGVYPLRTVREEAVRVIDEDAIDHGSGETDILGPFITDARHRGLVWHNNSTWYEIMSRLTEEDTEEEQLLNWIAGGLGTTIYNKAYQDGYDGSRDDIDDDDDDEVAGEDD